MLTIRLFRVGRKNQAAFKIVVTDKRNAASRGRFVEEVGFYNPLTKQRNLKGDRVKYWMSVGAKPSDTVHNMLITDGVIEGKKIPKHKLAKASEGDDSTATKEETTAPAATEQTPEATQEEQKEQSKEEPKKEETPAEEPNPSGGGKEEKPAELKAEPAPESEKEAENKPEEEQK